MKKEYHVKVPAFSIKNVSGVKFGGFAVDNHMCCGSHKRVLRGKNLPEAMIIAADKGKGWHLTTSFEWASMAYLWQKANTIDDCIVDIHAETYQWVMGLFMQPDGHVDILANIDVTYAGSPYGRGTISNSGKANPILKCDGKGLNWHKQWKPGSFNGLSIYIAEANNGAGEFFPIQKTTENSIILSKGVVPGNGIATYCIIKHVAIDVTSGMTSGNKITKLRESDAELKPFAIPASSGNNNVEMIADRYWFYKGDSVRAALRGGNFDTAAVAGVFYLVMIDAPSNSYYGVGFRACKAL